MRLRSQCMARLRARRQMELAQCVYAACAATTADVKNGHRVYKQLMQILEKQANG